MKFSSQLQIIGCICLGLLVGCESGKKRDATVQGTVTIDGDLAKSGTVVFQPTNDLPAAYGTILRDGTFVLRIGQGNQRDQDTSKIHSGEYIATLSIKGPSTPDLELGEGAPPKPGAKLISASYGSKATSGLAYTIKPGLNVINIDVEAISEEELLEESIDEETSEQPMEGEEPAPEVDDSQPDDMEETTEESSP